MLKDSYNYEIYDDYYTPKSAWEQIKHIIPKDKIIWEACMLNSQLSKSPEYLADITGNEIVFNKEWNFLECEPPNYDIIVTNPPFDKKIKIPILERMVKLDKPFILVLNTMNTFTKYMREIFKGNLQHLQIITPDNKIHFDKLIDGELKPTKNCSFYCIYLCYKMELAPENLWITSPPKRKVKA